MRIKKVSQTTPVQAHLTNAYSESTQDGYIADYINRLHEYSTTEQRVGTWIDGKPIYRKVVNFGELPNATTKEVDHGITNLDYIVDIQAIAITSNKYFLSIPYLDTGTSNNNITIFGSSTKIGIYAKDNKSTYSTYIVIEYTKTTN